jgi:protein-S-isoprenylcysteine O-methyltransferase Ste14
LPVGSVVIVAAAIVSVLLSNYFIIVTPAEGLWALLAYCASLLLFGWTVSASSGKGLIPVHGKREPTQLLVKGPYRYVRHPFYASYILYHAGNALATRSVVPWTFFALIFALYLHAAWREERSLSASAAYRVYRRKVGMFIPWLGS